MNLPVSKEWHAWTYSETTEFQTSTQVGGCALLRLLIPLVFARPQVP